MGVSRRLFSEVFVELKVLFVCLGNLDSKGLDSKGLDSKGLGSEGLDSEGLNALETLVSGN